MKIKCISLCIAAYAVFAGITNGQTPDIITSKFSVLSWKRTINDLHFESLRDGETKFFVPNGAPSAVYDYSGMGPLNFYKYDGVDEVGNPIKQIVASYSPQAGDEHLLIFIPDRKNGKEHYRILPLDYSPENIAEGTYRFHNLASYPVFIRFGRDTFKVDAGSSEAVLSDATSADGLDVAMALQVSEEPNSAKVVYSAGWALKPGRSALVFITNDRGIRGRIDVKRIYFQR